MFSLRSISWKLPELILLFKKWRMLFLRRLGGEGDMYQFIFRQSQSRGRLEGMLMLMEIPMFSMLQL